MSECAGCVTRAPLIKTMEQIIDMYVAAYPHLATLARNAKAGSVQAMKTLGDNMSRLAYPVGITGKDALTVSFVGLRYAR